VGFGLNTDRARDTTIRIGHRSLSQLDPARATIALVQHHIVGHRLAVNDAAIPIAILESGLLGHEKGPQDLTVGLRDTRIRSPAAFGSLPPRDRRTGCCPCVPPPSLYAVGDRVPREKERQVADLP